MKTFFSLTILVLVNFGLMGQVNDYRRQTKSKQIINRIQISVLNGKPINFYLNHPSIDKNSKRIYKGELGFSRDTIPTDILDSLFTRNSETRPFYFFIFNQFVEQSEGKMIDRVAVRCTEFVERYPCEFFNSFIQPDLNINVVKWTTFIGMSLKDRVGYADFRGLVDFKLRANCGDAQDLSKSFFAEVRMCLVR
jgi:hypothetical protein